LFGYCINSLYITFITSPSSLNLSSYQGLQTLSLANKAAAFASMFCPFVPKELVPQGLINCADKFVDGLDQETYKEEDGGNPKRGSELRDFEAFLSLHDKKCKYSGLRRVCNKKEGNAIWVTEESSNMLEFSANDSPGGNELQTKGLDKKLVELKKDNALLKKQLSAAKASGDLPSSTKKDDESEKLLVLNGILQEEVNGLKYSLSSITRASAYSSDSSYIDKDSMSSGPITTRPHSSSGASATSLAIVKQGVLLKKSKYLKKWEERAMTLTIGGQLMWIAGGSHKGFTSLSTASQIIGLKEVDGRFEFCLLSEGRKILFGSKDMSNRDAWVNAIREFCSH